MNDHSGAEREIALLQPALGDDWAARRRAKREAEARDMRALRAQLLAAAREAGATTITVAYTGGYDSGCVEEIAIEPETAATALEQISVERPNRVWDAETKTWRPTTTTVPFRNCVEDLLTWALTEEVGNWWDGDIETDGEIVWHVGNDPDRVEGEHNEVVRTPEYSTWEA